MKKLMSAVAVVMSASMFAACGKTEEKASDEASGAQKAAAENTPAAVEKETNAAGEVAGLIAEAAEDTEIPTGIEEAAKALEKVRQVADKVEGDTPCERGYSGLTQVMSAMSVSGDKVPTKEKYLEVCHAFPEPMQKCMDMSYGMKNVQECKKVREQTDPALLERAKALMTK